MHTPRWGESGAWSKVHVFSKQPPVKIIGNHHQEKGSVKMKTKSWIDLGGKFSKVSVPGAKCVNYKKFYNDGLIFSRNQNFSNKRLKNLQHIYVPTHCH